ncbi:MAG: PAS domain S-box protein [Chloroflexi bacterium]|nr:PAS domain S-box protein [Chloroflexota bacterium]MDL1883374.1 PAS domain S-box protein [Anaerolineae bacterium CFX8]
MFTSNRQRIQPTLEWLASVSNRLGRPAPSLADPEARRRSRLLLLVALIVSSGPILVFQALTNPGSFDNFDFWMAVVIWLSSFGLYSWARRGHTTAAAAVLIALLFVLFTVAPFTPDSFSSSPFFVIIPLLLTALFFSLRWTIALAGLALIVQVGLLALVPPVNTTTSRVLVLESLLFILSVGSIILVYANHQNATERIRRAELQAAHDRVRESEAALEQRVEERARALIRSERSLQEAQRRYHALFEQAHDAVFILDLAGNHVETNRRAADMLGYTVEEMNKLSFRDLSAEAAKSENIRQRLLAGERIPVYERIFHKKDGTLVPIEINAELVCDMDGTPLHIQSVVRDISERKQMENNLLGSEARHRALLGAIPDLVFRVSRDGTHLDYHAGNINDLAVPPEQFLGRTIREVMPPESAERHMRAIEQVLQTGEEQTYEYALTIGEQLLHFEARMVAAGPDEVLTIVRNITERKQARQREFDLALERERVQLLRHFIEKTSHEFRTPLSVINAAAFLMQRTDDPENRAGKVRQIEEQVQLITRLVNSLLLMARLESSSTLARLPVSMNVIFESLCHAITARYSGGPAIQCEEHPDLPPVMGDPDYLMEALRQILDNACRFSPPDSTIMVAAGADDSHIWITVRDSGPGIPEDHLPHIFDLFWRGDEVHTTPGFGLGLPIARKIIELHGGRIDVESEIGAGSTFSISLPAAARRTSPSV